MQSIKAWWRKNWGFGIFLLDALASLLMLAIRGQTGHYINFTEPARYLWRLEDPYGVTFPGSPGNFFYSPGAALYFYGFFTLFTPRVGQLIYMGISLLVFWLGLSSLLRALQKRVGFNVRESSYRHLFWLMVGSELIGGMVAVKIDVLIVGVVLWTVSALLTQTAVGIAVFALGLVTSWKLHPFSIFGLLFLALFAEDTKRAIRAGGIFLAGVATGFLSPLVFLPVPFAVKVFQHWRTSLAEFVEARWLDDIFQHLFGFVARTFHVPIDLAFANRVAALVGLILAAVVFYSSRQLLKTKTNEMARSLSLLAAVGLGSGYIVMFSQLIQSNSYIVYIPLPLAFIVFAELLDWEKRTTMTLLVVSYLTISIAYSDLNPRPLYHLIYDSGIKPLGVLLLFFPTLAGLWRLAHFHVPLLRRASTLG